MRRTTAARAMSRRDFMAGLLFVVQASSLQLHRVDFHSQDHTEWQCGLRRTCKLEACTTENRLFFNDNRVFQFVHRGELLNLGLDAEDSHDVERAVLNVTGRD